MFLGVFCGLRVVVFLWFVFGVLVVVCFVVCFVVGFGVFWGCAVVCLVVCLGFVFAGLGVWWSRWGVVHHLRGAPMKSHKKTCFRFLGVLLVFVVCVFGRLL